MAVWGKVVKPLAGRKVGDVERFGDHEAGIWLSAGFIEETDDPNPAPVKAVAPPIKAPPVVARTRKAPAK